MPRAGAPLKGLRYLAPREAFLDNFRQRQTAIALSLETAVVSFNKLGATRLFFYPSFLFSKLKAPSPLTCY